MADDDDHLATSGHRARHGLRRRPGRETIVRGGLDVELAADERAGFAGTEERAGEDRVRADARVAKARPERAGLLATGGREGAQLVGLSSSRLGVAHEVELHGRRRIPSCQMAAGTYRYVVADVFTDRPLEGNGLAVFTDARELPEERLQPLARELNLSETVFVFPPEDGGHVRIRIFTPAAELPFAGHPVLGTAFVLAGPLQLVEINLETGAGLVPVRLEREGPRITFGWMTQPVPTVETYQEPERLLAALGLERSQLPIELYDNGLRFVYVALESEETVAAVQPDMAALAQLDFLGANCFAGEGRRWKTRMFAPGSGVAEDPATGSAAGPLACHLARHGRISFGDEIEISQGTEVQRPSTLFARVEGTPERIERVDVGGAAVVVARGEFRL